MLVRTLLWVVGVILGRLLLDALHVPPMQQLGAFLGIILTAFFWRLFRGSTR